ncbi:MAG: FecR domain-containing protein [Gemmatimonas sp.]
MSVVLPTPDVQQFQAFTQGDEGALKSIFRAEYDALIARASEELGPDLKHASGRVVQNAMLGTWQRRREFSAPSGLVAVLEAAVVEEAASSRRRHASLHHRPGSQPVKHAPLPTADEAIAALDATLHAPPPDHDRLIEESRLAKKHHAAEHVQAVGRKTSWAIPAALIVVAIIAIVAAQRWAAARGGDMAATKALQSEEARDVASARGQRGALTLGDDSRARLGSDSKLRLPKEFGLNIRTLELTGTAHFTVAAGKTEAFTVRAGGMDIVAEGTEFAVRAFPDEGPISVMVNEGTVRVYVRDSKETHTVNAGQAVRVNADGALASLAPDARDAAFAWTRDSLVFTDAPLKDVVPQLIRWYDLKLALGDAALGDKRVSARLGLESSGAALEAIRKAAGLTLEFGADKETILK